MKNVKWILYILLLFSVAACKEDDELKMETVEMPVYIAIPAAGFSSPTDVGIDGEATEGRGTRAPSDPGTDEQFELPQFIHVYLKTTNGGVQNVNYTKFAVSKNDWKLSTGDDNENDHFQDDARKDLYVYQGHLSMSVPAKREQGEVYIAACDVDLERYGLNKNITDPAQVTRQATLNCSAELNPHLKNLYSTPYNLTDKKTGKYYGIIQDFADQVPHLDIVLYHTATKVDVQWQIDEECQGVKPWADTNSTDMSAEDDAGRVYFSGIEVLNLPVTCPLFRPMDCRPSEYGTNSYAVPLHTNAAEHKGQRYNGRSVAYVIPRRYPTNGFDYFMGLRMQVNGYAAEGKGHHAYIQIKDEEITQTADGSPVYTPWLRAFVHVTKDNVANLVTLNNERQYENIR